MHLSLFHSPFPYNYGEKSFVANAASIHGLCTRKVIVFGEHAAIYNKPAIAAAISLRFYLLVTTLSKSQRTVTLNFSDIGLHHCWEIDSLPWGVFCEPSKKTSYFGRVQALDSDLLSAITPLAEAVSESLPEKQRKVHIRSATAFLYLFLSLGSPESPGFVYTLRSTIPIGAGLGSSASICVYLSTALLLQTRALAGPHSDQPSKEAELQLERINQWAFVGELCIHGDPSGVDNAVSTKGRAVVFQRKDSDPPLVTPITVFPKLPLLLVDTKQSRSTATQVEQVKSLLKKHPENVTHILEGIGKLTTSALVHIESIKSNNQISSSTLEHLGEMIRMNHGYLVSLGASHPRLERIRELVDFAGIGWTKLTGAGGGGCAITLCRHDAEENLIRELEQKLAGDGFSTYKTILGADGVGVLWPAVFRGGANGIGKREIDQESFESARDAREIEWLVGVRENQEGWKFWI